MRDDCSLGAETNMIFEAETNVTFGAETNMIFRAETYFGIFWVGTLISCILHENFEILVNFLIGSSWVS